MSTNDLQGAALALGSLMSDISEEVYAASWLQETEWILWRALLNWRQAGQAYWWPELNFADITEHMPALDRLQREAGGWVWWLDGMTFVAEERWLLLVQAKAQSERTSAGLDNAALDRAVE